MNHSWNLTFAFIASSVAGFLLFIPFPDLDISVLGIGYHRNFLFHSAILSVVSFAALSTKRKGPIPDCSNGIAFGVSLAIFLHLLIDVFQRKSIHFMVASTLVRDTIVDDNLWLGGNALASLMTGLRVVRKRMDSHP